MHDRGMQIQFAGPPGRMVRPAAICRTCLVSQFWRVMRAFMVGWLTFCSVRGLFHLRPHSSRAAVWQRRWRSRPARTHLAQVGLAPALSHLVDGALQGGGLVLVGGKQCVIGPACGQGWCRRVSAEATAAAAALRAAHALRWRLQWQPLTVGKLAGQGVFAYTWGRNWSHGVGIHSPRGPINPPGPHSRPYTRCCCAHLCSSTHAAGS